MANKQPPPNVPESPDELNGGLRGRISGVTRVGPKALGAAAMVIGGLVLAIMWGINHGGGAPPASQVPTISTNVKSNEHFGADVPIVATAEPTEAPITLPTSEAGGTAVTGAGAVPNLKPTRVPAPSNPQPNQAEEDARRQRRAILDQAIHSKIITDENRVSPPSDTSANCVDASGRQFIPGAGGAGAALQQQQQPYAAAVASTANGRDFLNGPLGQYSCLASSETAKDDYLNSRRATPRSAYEVLAGSIIPASLITGINSELPGIVSAEVREDVFDSKSGRFLLIPRGSRLLGLYRSGAQYGQSRVLVAWTRLIFPDTTGIDLLGMTGADVEGNAGLTGTVDNHTGKVFGAALLTSILSAGLQLSQPYQQTYYPNAGQIAAGSAGQQILSLGGQLASRAMGIAPIIIIPKGYPFSVMVDKDIVFPGTYRGM